MGVGAAVGAATATALAAGRFGRDGCEARALRNPPNRRATLRGIRGVRRIPHY